MTFKGLSAKVMSMFSAGNGEDLLKLNNVHGSEVFVTENGSTASRTSSSKLSTQAWALSSFKMVFDGFKCYYNMWFNKGETLNKSKDSSDFVSFWSR